MRKLCLALLLCACALVWTGCATTASSDECCPTTNTTASVSGASTGWTLVLPGERY